MNPEHASSCSAGAVLRTHPTIAAPLDASRTAPRRATFRVLLVDDDAGCRDRIAGSVSRMSIDVELVVADGYRDALARMLRDGVDLCLVDDRVGDRSGIELLREAAVRGCRVPTIVMSHRADRAIDLEAMTAGAADYLVKEELTHQLLERAIRYAVERDRIVQQLRRSEQRLQTVISGAPIILFACDRAGIITLFDGRDLDALGRDPADVIGHSVFDVFAHNGALIAAVRSALAGATIEALIPFRNRTYQARYAPVVDVAGEPDGFIGVATDITAWAESEARRHREEERFRLMIENARDAITLLDASGRRIYESPSMSILGGYTHDDLHGREPFELIHPDDQQRARRALVDAIAEPGTVRQVEFRWRHSDGHWLHIESTVQNLLDVPSVGGIVVNSRDVSERREIERERERMVSALEDHVRERTLELREAMDALERAHLRQRRFVADASHDLRTPLTVLRAELDLLIAHAPEPGELAEGLARAAENTRRLERLSSDLLMLATLDGDESIAGATRVRIDEEVLECITGLSAIAREKGVRWDIQLEESAHVDCDVALIRRALGNLMENAIKYSPHEGTVRVALRVFDTIIELEIADEGPGISPADQPKLFDRFFRGDAARSTAGTGLGLSIVKSAIELHGGTVDVRGGRGRGATAVVVLPRVARE